MSGHDKVYRGARENLVVVTKVLKLLFAVPVKIRTSLLNLEF